MPENVSKNDRNKVIKPDLNMVKITIRKIKMDKEGHKYEVIEEKEVPDFIAKLFLEEKY